MDYHKLHVQSGTHEPYGYWLQEKWTEFRRIYGLVYQPRTIEEAKAFDDWIYKRVRRKR